MAGEGDFDQKRAVWRDQVAGDLNLKPLAFRLAYVLSRYMNRDTGDAWPSQQTLAEQIGATDRHVRDMVAALVAGGHLQVIIKGRSHRYRMVVWGQNTGTTVPQSTGNDTGSPVPVSAETANTGTATKTADTGTTVPLIPEPQFRLTLIKNPLESLSSDLPSKPKRIRKPKAEPDGFDEWYRAYPRREARADAAKSYAKAIETVPGPDLLAAAKRYAALKAGEEARFVKLPATWLNKGCWADEVPSGQTASGATPKPLHAVDRASRLKAKIERGEWATGWGPGEGEPGCQITPAEWTEARRQHEARKAA